MDLADYVWAGEYQQVVVALQVAGMVFKIAGPVILFLQSVALN